MKRILILVVLGSFLGSTASAFQGGGGEATKKAANRKKMVPKKKTSFTLDQIIMPSKLDEIKNLVCHDSKKRFVEAKNKVITSMRDPHGGWNGGPELWYEKSMLDVSFEDGWQAEMKKACSEIQIEKQVKVSNEGISFLYYAGIGLPMSVREMEPASDYFYSWAVLKPFLMPSSPISALVK
jgi:hypothetical protein